jgi:tellurite resistance protein
MAKPRRPRGAKEAGASRGLDRALIALFIGAMNANGVVARDEAARAHHLIWSTRRFRRKSGDTVGKLIQDVRARLERDDADVAIDRAARQLPARLRQPAFAVLADLLLADGRMDAQERRFLARIGSQLKIEPGAAQQVIEVVLLKNQL